MTDLKLTFLVRGGMGLLGKLCKQDFNLFKKSNGFQEFEKALIFSILHIIQLF